MSKDGKVYSFLASMVVLAFAATLGSVPAFAGAAVVGSVAGSVGSTVGGQPVLPNSVIFSGDTLRVAEGATALAISGGNRLVFGRDTEAFFLRNGSDVTVLLGQGDVSLYSAAASARLQVKALDLSITPKPGFKTLGEVAMSGSAVVVRVKEGSMRVEGHGSPMEVTEGQAITIQPKTMRAPQATVGGGGGGGRSSNDKLILAAVGLGAGGLVVGSIGISRADNANNNAKSAIGAATAAASAAAEAALAAQTAASAAAAAEAASLLEANIVGCDLNNFANSQGEPSPYTPPSGFSCR